ncbi:MAG: hypothetical protein A3B25_01370 [Candidatus Ryanbacteria bacterium RIFCSPLOWO2_01_FULL_48_26]|uniref:Uncharacterized protein n=1 Tax=Candidatus Ryanbacteria bacterium RIFCSPLOWO2_01_FULL_48_26 TaxID=1802126 RepID=A0A1G2GU06_9BACT|nr:MAG: hypothetical protein A3B25_01370 [Candidatus Ryanbacteria bacterium RIFCSPLOWO2_01_FULL_48_26]
MPPWPKAPGRPAFLLFARIVLTRLCLWFEKEGASHLLVFRKVKISVWSNQKTAELSSTVFW